jgi:hypothetical protein
MHSSNVGLDCVTQLKHRIDDLLVVVMMIELENRAHLTRVGSPFLRLVRPDL